jgi:hypothetical protein
MSKSAVLRTAAVHDAAVANHHDAVGQLQQFVQVLTHH